MKKFLAILLALLFVVALFGCAAKEPQGGDNKDPKPTSTGSPATGTPDDGPEFPKYVGYYDPDFDYTKFPKYKIAFLSMTAGELWDAFDIAYENWANKVNIAYTNIWAPTQYSAEEFISGMQTFVDQGYDGLILEGGVQNYERIDEILSEQDVHWLSGLGAARTMSGDNRLLRPQIGFDNYTVGMTTVDLLVEWKEETWPDVPWEKVGMLVLDFSYADDIHTRAIGMEQRWAELFPEFGSYDPAPDKNPENFYIGDIATATNPDQTAAQNLATQFLSNPPKDIDVWLIGTPADLYSVGAANAAEKLGMTDTVCTACQGGVALASRFDSGIDDAWRFAIFTSQQIYAEPIICMLWAFMSGQATPDTIYPEWVDVNDKGDVKDENGNVIEEHNYPKMMLPVQVIDKDNYQAYLEWTDLYAFGPGEEGVWKYEPVTDINLFSAKMDPPEYYKIKK
jgi:ABC-type sugar transport system substrate-binding protein